MAIKKWTYFQSVFRELKQGVLTEGRATRTNRWQSKEGTPFSDTIELMFVDFTLPVVRTMKEWQEEVMPSLPWAEDHFQERVGGEPLNPPPSHAWWPYAGRRANEDHLTQGRFSHSYPERLWSGDSDHADLDSLVALLTVDPTTRQAFIPIWWPVDGTLAGKERVPCTIGYHILIRENELHCNYYLRSCDLLRHFSDDVYMAGRLMQWLCEALPHRGLTPGSLHLAITSLHIFEGDVPNLSREVLKEC